MATCSQEVFVEILFLQILHRQHFPLISTSSLITNSVGNSSSSHCITLLCYSQSCSPFLFLSNVCCSSTARPVRCWSPVDAVSSAKFYWASLTAGTPQLRVDVTWRNDDRWRSRCRLSAATQRLTECTTVSVGHEIVQDRINGTTDEKQHTCTERCLFSTRIRAASKLNKKYSQDTEQSNLGCFLWPATVVKHVPRNAVVNEADRLKCKEWFAVYISTFANRARSQLHSV